LGTSRWAACFLLVALSLSLALTVPPTAKAFEGGADPLGDGMLDPWPFPWAKECPVSWESMEGRFIMADSFGREEILIAISEVPLLGHLVKIRRVTRFGAMVGEGVALIRAGQRSVRMQLRSGVRGLRPSTATLRMYYPDQTFQCSELVPILSIEPMDDIEPHEAQYRLVKVR
jgi:hypothetical protein